MQSSQIKEQFGAIRRRIDAAATTCQISNAVPEELRNSIGMLNRESAEFQSVIDSDINENRIQECVDRLEKLADRAMQACRQDSNVDPQVESVVREAHDAISGLKHRLH